MQDVVELIPSEQDEAIYAAWEGGKTLRVLAREFGVSVMEAERAIDRCLPVFNSQTQMRAYKREIQKLEDLGSKYHAKAMRDEKPEDAHIYARLNERYCAMQGWSSVNVRLDPYSAQTEQQPTQYERIRDAIMRVVNEAPTAQRAVIKKMEELGPEKVLELINAGNSNGSSAPSDQTH